LTKFHVREVKKVRSRNLKTKELKKISAILWLLGSREPFILLLMVLMAVIGLVLIIIFKGTWWTWLFWASETLLYLWYKWEGERIIEWL